MFEYDENNILHLCKKSKEGRVDKHNFGSMVQNEQKDKVTPSAPNHAISKSSFSNFNGLNTIASTRNTFTRDQAVTREHFDKLKLRYMIQYKANFVNGKNDKREVQMAKKAIADLKGDIQGLKNDVKTKEAESEALKAEEESLAYNNKTSRDTVENSWYSSRRYPSTENNSEISRTPTQRHSGLHESLIEG